MSLPASPAQVFSPNGSLRSSSSSSSSPPPPPRPLSPSFHLLGTIITSYLELWGKVNDYDELVARETALMPRGLMEVALLPKGKTLYKRDLHASVRSRGFKIVDVVADNDNLYRCIAYLVYRSEDSYSSLRNDCNDYKGKGEWKQLIDIALVDKIGNPEHAGLLDIVYLAAKLECYFRICLVYPKENGISGIDENNLLLFCLTISDYRYNSRIRRDSYRKPSAP